jgi:hypothetical protein
MTLTNWDASQVTLKRKQKALHAWNSINTVQVNLGLSILKAQPTLQTSTVVVDSAQGGCKCSTDALANPYQFNGLSQCGCGQ